MSPIWTTLLWLITWPGFTAARSKLDGLTPHCARLLGVPCGTVIWFSDYTFIKLESEARRNQLLSLSPHAVNSVARLPCARQKAVLYELWWLKSTLGKSSAFLVVLKATRKAEVFVETFHAIDRKEARRLLKRAQDDDRLVRSQPGAATLLKRGTDHLRKKKSAVLWRKRHRGVANDL